MGFVTAVSISGLLGNVSTVAGIVAAVAVAVLATLVLNQGRELQSLREDLEFEEDRAYAAEGALAAHAAAVPQQAAAAQPSVPPVQSGAVKVSPAATVAVSVAQAAVDATEEISSGAPALGSATAAPSVAARAVTARVTTVPEPATPPAPTPPIVIAAPAAATPAARTDAASKVVGVPTTAAAGGATRAPRRPSSPEPSKSRRNLLPIVLATVLIVGIALLAVNQFGGNSSSTSGSTNPTSTVGASTGTSGTGAIVAVLNGTPVSGLAGQVASELSQGGFKRGPVTTARDQQTKSTIVAYMPGHAVDAEAVAKLLGVTTPVAPADDATQAIACPDAATCTAEVIVTVGADRTR
ncbi:unannotated protein [freshwater metagenome]|uniref:Unannotated protein n=1 Tax=freshwater metagenome TaxID=449393 RepID=A0A6J7DHS2_9ZZZZ